MLRIIGFQDARGRALWAVASLLAITWSARQWIEFATGPESRPMPDAFSPIVAVEPDANGFAPQQVVPAFPAIVDAPFISGAQASAEVVRASELVLGVEIAGHARAYPINMLTGPDREIINDRLGGRRLAATW